MGATIKGASVYNTPSSQGAVNYHTDVIGKNSVAFTVGDPVQIASGVLDVAGTTNTVVGVAVKTVTMASDNQTNAKVAPEYVPADENYVFLMGTNADLTGNATDGGTYYKLTAATTATVQVDVTSGVQVTTSRVVEILKVDPFNEGGTGAGSGLRKCLVKFVKTPTLGINTV